MFTHHKRHYSNSASDVWLGVIENETAIARNNKWLRYFDGHTQFRAGEKERKKNKRIKVERKAVGKGKMNCTACQVDST